MRFLARSRVLVLVGLVASLAFAADPAKPSPLFPLPSPNGKPLAATEGQKTFRIPLRMARVEQFYRDRFAHVPEVTLTSGLKDGHKTLTLVSKRKTDSWTKAVVREGEMETVVELTPVMRLGEEHVSGKAARPQVEFVITRSEEARKMSEQIDHLEHRE